MTPLEDIRLLIARHARPSDMSTSLPGLRLMASTTLSRPVQTVYEPAIAFVAQGAKRTIVGSHTLEYETGQYLIVPIDLPITGYVVRASAKEPFLALGLTLQHATIAALLLEFGEGDRPCPHPQSVNVYSAPLELLEPIARLLRLLDRPKDAPVLQPMLEREIIWRILGSSGSAVIRQIGLADSHLSQIRRVTRWIRAHYNKSLRIEDLARIANMSQPSFHRHFRAITLMSPLQYQKQIRLQHARAKLLSGAVDVASVGFEVGYDSPSQFSREYARVFGNPPLRDIIRLRKGSAVDQDPASLGNKAISGE